MKSTEVQITGTERFRRTAIIGTLVMSIVSALLVLLDPRKCELVKLEVAVYICAGVHLLTFLLLLASYMSVKCVNALGHIMSIFYFGIVGSMIGVQVIFFHG